MIDIKLSIQGTTPLLCNRFTDEAQEKATNGTALSTVGDRGSPHQIAEKKLYMGSDGKPMIPAPNLFATIMNGGKFFKAGKSKVTTLKTSMIPSCLQIEEHELPIEYKEPWCVDTRPVRVPATGGRILAHRPCFNDWKLNLNMELDESIMSSGLLREIVDAAGKRVGLGDYRPDCKGPFGKFVVVEWKESAQG